MESERQVWKENGASAEYSVGPMTVMVAVTNPDGSESGRMRIEDEPILGAKAERGRDGDETVSATGSEDLTEVLPVWPI